MINRATTPTFVFKFPTTIDNYDDGRLAFSQNKNIVLEKDLTNLTLVEETTYSLQLTQDEANLFEPGIFDCQWRIMIDDEVAASYIYRGRINDVLDDVVMGE